MNTRLYISNGRHSSVALVFIHGFLGSGDDWQNIVDRFSDYTCVTLDLPAHGASQEITVGNFSDLLTILCKTLNDTLPNTIERVVFIGYSLGGRVAMMLARRLAQDPTLLKKPVAGWVIESASPGLASDAERAARLSADQHWANRFAGEPVETVLVDWYHQPVFSDLSCSERTRLISRRAKNNGKILAAFLLATSTAKQPNLLHFMNTITLPWLYIVGERDQKFYDSANRSAFPLSVIPNVGHDTHTRAPEWFCDVLRNFLNTVSRQKV